MSAPDCTLRCQICGETKEVNFSESLRRGWARHCGYVMRLVDPVDEETVRAATEAAFLPESQRKADIPPREILYGLPKRGRAKVFV